VRTRGPHSLAAHVRNGFKILTEYDLPHPDANTMKHVVEASLAARHLFFATSLYEPSDLDLFGVFQDFVLRCVKPLASDVL